MHTCESLRVINCLRQSDNIDIAGKGKAHLGPTTITLEFSLSLFPMEWSTSLSLSSCKRCNLIFSKPGHFEGETWTVRKRPWKKHLTTRDTKALSSFFTFKTFLAFLLGGFKLGQISGTYTETSISSVLDSL